MRYRIAGWRHALSLCHQITDFGQQLDLVRRFCGRCWRCHLLFFAQTLDGIHDLDRHEHGKSDDHEIEDAWAAEVERRNADIESGAVSLVPGPEALARLKAEFR